MMYKEESVVVVEGGRSKFRDQMEYNNWERCFKLRFILCRDFVTDQIVDEKLFDIEDVVDIRVVAISCPLKMRTIRVIFT